MIARTLYRLKIKVRGNAKILTEIFVEGWTEIIDDIWNKLPHIQDKEELYNSENLNFGCVNQQLGEAEESDNDNETWPNKSVPDVDKSIIIEKGKISRNECKLINW